MPEKTKLRILLGKAGLDGHDRGIKVIARGFRDAGFEVIYTGVHQMPEQIVNAAIQEDVDMVGLSCLSGAHIHLFSEVVKGLKERGATDVTVIGGGIIPAEDVSALKKAGVTEVFLPGTSIQTIVSWVNKHVKPL
jgi:methylmalonyl-CoA mutase, C-terminal domain